MSYYGSEAQRGGRKRAFSDASRNDNAYYEPQSYAPRPRFESFRGHRGGYRGNNRGGQRGGFRGSYRGAGFHHQYPQNNSYQHPPTTSTPPPAKKKTEPTKQSQSKAPNGKGQKKASGERKLPTHKRPQGKIFFIGSLEDWKIETSAVQSFYKREIQYVSR